MVLPYRIVKHEPDEYGRKYIDIFITNGAEKDLAIMTVYLESNTRKHFRRLDQINISYVEKYYKNIKGCFHEFIKILIYQTPEIFGRKLTNSTEVLLFISPQQPPGGIDFDELFSTEQLKKLYKANGFKNYDLKNPLFMVTTISKLKDVIDGKQIIDDPYKTPNESISQDSPIRPVKLENQERISINEVPVFKLYIQPRYVRSTFSSRRKKFIDDLYKTPNKSISQSSPITTIKPKNQEHISISEVPAFKLYIPPKYLRSTVSSRGKRVEKRGGSNKTRKQH